MVLIAKTYWGGAPFRYRQPPRAECEPLVLRTADFREVTGLYWRPPQPSKVAVVCMHPRVDFTQHYSFPRLLAAGVTCIGANSRNPNNDMDTVHEELLLDVAACVLEAKRRGAEKVVLLGNSGGGSLMAYYQAQALLPAGERREHDPSGAPTRLRRADMPAADAMLYIAAHPGQGRVLGEALDPSVSDEDDPLATDVSLDMYAPANGFAEPPAWSRYDAAFVARYRDAQRARAERLDASARAHIERAERAAQRVAEAGGDFAAKQALERIAQHQPIMRIYRTMANLSYVDDSLDPSPRSYGSLLSDRPDLMNHRALGFARVCTARAWLSTWSPLSSAADMLANLPAIATPTLVVHAGRDREIHPRQQRAIDAALAAEDATVITMPDAGHYFEPEDFAAREAPDVEALMDHVLAWLGERFAIDEGTPRESGAGGETTARHPTTQGWSFPPARPTRSDGIRRTNLHELMARPGRYEHHLMVIGRMGNTQLELVTASEPLYFTHANLSDEYALALPTGHAMLDGFPLRTFISDPQTGAHVARVNHRAGDLVLHPYGFLHWPGQLKPPYAPPPMPPGMRRTGLSLVFCATRHSPPETRPLFVSEGRSDAVKIYGDAEVPMLLAELLRERSRELARIGSVKLDLVVGGAVAAPEGAFVVMLEEDGDDHPGDLLYLAPSQGLARVGRALVLHGAPIEPPPKSWDEIPRSPLERYEDSQPLPLPRRFPEGLLVEESSDAGGVHSVAVTLGDGEGALTRNIPRYWLARMLFRLALHDFQLGYVETYGGFYYDDRDGYAFGFRDGPRVRCERERLLPICGELYRAVAPAGYREDLLP